MGWELASEKVRDYDIVIGYYGRQSYVFGEIVTVCNCVIMI